MWNPQSGEPLLAQVSHASTFDFHLLMTSSQVVNAGDISPHQRRWTWGLAKLLSGHARKDLEIDQVMD